MNKELVCSLARLDPGKRRVTATERPEIAAWAD